MYAFLSGNYVFKSPALVHIDVNGVGYELHISLNTYASIQQLEKGTLYTHLIVREDAHLLFGFFDHAEKEMFLHLLSVSGVGASTARMMLSYMKPIELAACIANGDTRSLEGIKGIGKKSAERLVLELKDKLTKNNLETNISALKNNTLQQDALNALLALGINRQAATNAVEKTVAAHPNYAVEELIKQVLRTL